MKDAEFIYSLYVQANPVPDPDLLPLTEDEAVLLILERSPDMITEERPDSPQLPPKPKRLVPALAAAAVVMVAVVAAALLMSGDLAPVAAADADLRLEFDGTACSYEGPTRIEEGLAQISVMNSSSEVFKFSSVKIVETLLERQLEQYPVGSDWAEPAGGLLPPGVMYIVRVNPGELSRPDWLLEPGIYLVDCTTGDHGDGFPEHIWRVAQVEVVAAG